MSVRRPILQRPDPRLSRVAAPAVPGTPAIRKAAQTLVRAATVARPAAVGLAAPQIGVDMRLIAMRADNRAPFAVVANPVFHPDPAAPVEVGEEACLSVGLGRVIYEVARPTAGVLVGETIDGEPVRLELAGFMARVAQHEIDHLDGITIVDRARQLEVTP